MAVAYRDYSFRYCIENDGGCYQYSCIYGCRILGGDLFQHHSGSGVLLTRCSNEKLPDYMLPRQDVMTRLSGALRRSMFETVLVYGARGSGKTTAFTQCMHKRVGVKV